MQPADGGTLVGFYGKETMRERIARQPPLLGVGCGRKKVGSRGNGGGVREGEGGREGEVVGGEIVGERGGGEGERRRGRRGSSIGNWLSRKRTS